MAVNEQIVYVGEHGKAYGPGAWDFEANAPTGEGRVYEPGELDAEQQAEREAEAEARAEAEAADESPKPRRGRKATDPTAKEA